MDPTIKTMITIVLVMALLSLASACSMTRSNIGKTAFEGERIVLDNRDGLWQTNDVAVSHSISTSGNSLSISGTVYIQDNISYSFPLVEYFNLYINLLDQNGRVISTYDVSPNIGFRSEYEDDLFFREVVPRPPEATSIAFSYWGEFRGRNEDRRVSTGDWEIYHNPFKKASLKYN